jgi:hypothetical protein
MAGFGVPQDDTALVVRCTSRTLRKWYRQELGLAVIEANARVAQCLCQQATTPGNLGATIFWLKARAGWREKHAVEVTGRDGAALIPPHVVEWVIVEPNRDKAPLVLEGQSA